MSEEGFEEWDAEFLDQLIQVEELALSASSSTAIPNHHQPLPSLHRRLPEPPAPAEPRRTVTHSPPRELSQRTCRSADDRDLEIEGLKVRVLGPASLVEAFCVGIREMMLVRVFIGVLWILLIFFWIAERAWTCVEAALGLGMSFLSLHF